MVKAFKLIIAALISSLFTAILLAYLFRFPTVGGFVGPLGDISPYERPNQFGVLALITVTWAMYGLMGFFIAIAAGGLIAWMIGEATEMNTRNRHYLAAALGAFTTFYFPFSAELSPVIKSVLIF